MRTALVSSAAAAFLFSLVACSSADPQDPAGSTLPSNPSEAAGGSGAGPSSAAPAVPGAPGCGLPGNEPCAPAGPGGCTAGDQCPSGVCTAGACVAASPTDAVKNGDETDVDCGGAGAPSCAAGQACKVHGDCASDGCSYEGKCVSAKSCTAHFGGDTCGVGETGDPTAQHVSCCEAAPLFGAMTNVKLDKFLITAGRMRTFIERVNGDVRSFVHTLPASKWNPGWSDALVPSTPAEANEQLGSYFDKKSCHPGDHTGRTYWTPPTADDASAFSKDQLDEKALNCVTWHLVAAFCAWDGGHMATPAELRNAFTNGGQHTQPWMWKPGAQAYVQLNENSQPAPWTDTFNHAFTYNYPEAPNASEDAAYYISPPGRFPTSWNKNGHEIAGNLLTWNASSPFVFTRNFSWENHGGNDLSNSDWKHFEEHEDAATNAPNGYYAIGGRCARD